MSLPEHSLEKAHKIDEDSGSMVRAILEGRKTQTRRIVKQSRGLEKHSVCRPDMAADSWCVWWHYPETDRVGHLVECPYGTPGTHLWVRETFFSWRCKTYTQSGMILEPERYVYAADGRILLNGGKWKPSIHMPRTASRITLEITSVRVERLQDISEEDAKAEGVIPLDFKGTVNGTPANGVIFDSRLAFKLLWDSINAKRGFGWDKNPWVWVIDFKRVDAKQDNAA